MKPLFLLLFFSFLSNFAIAQDTLLTKLIAGLDRNYVSISNPIYLDNKIVFFTSLYADSLSVGDLKMVTLDTSGNLIQQKKITINGNFGILLSETKNIILNSEGNFVLLGMQFKGKDFLPCVMEITKDGKLLMQNHNAPKGVFQTISISEYKDKYLVEVVMPYISSDPDPLCGVNPSVIATYIINKEGKLISYFYGNIGFYKENSDSTVISISGSSKSIFNLYTLDNDYIFSAPKSNKYFWVDNGIALDNKEYFALGSVYDTLEKSSKNYLGIFSMENLAPKWVKTDPFISSNNQIYDAQQNTFNNKLLIVQNSDLWGFQGRKIGLYYVDRQGNTIWQRTDTLAHFGILYSNLGYINDYYTPFCFLPSGNICSLILSSYKYSNWEKKIYHESLDAYFIKFNSQGKTHSDLYKTAPNAVNSATAKPILIYPNPFSQSTTIELEGEYNDLTFNVFDMNGRLLRSEKFNSNRLNFERSGLDGGMYIYEILNDNKALQKGKVVIF